VFVIGLLRFVGLLNAALWFGTIAFQVFLTEPVTGSAAMQQLLGPKSFPYFSAAIAQVISSRCYILFLVCSLVALLHIGAEWLYFGKHPTRASLLLVFCLFIGGLIQSRSLEPRLRTLLIEQHNPSIHSTQREHAAAAFRMWHGVSIALNLFVLAGLYQYLWRVANPPEQMRFVGATTQSPAKFRS
jgi:hypothetical protein